MYQCSLCYSDQARSLWPVREVPGYLVCLCPNCGTSFLSPQPSDTFLRELYSQSYYDAWGMHDDAGIVREMKTASFAPHLGLIRRYKEKGRVLDVGCATGFFLEAARDLGYAPFGVEISPYSAGKAMEKFGAGAVFEGCLEDSSFPAQSFDVVVMSDLLEHVRDPHAVLAKTCELLKDNGVLVVMTPDTASLTHRIMRSRWPHYKVEHLFYFNRDSLRRLAEEHGFRIVHQEAARKTLNLAYVYHQFKRYRHWLLTPLCKMLYSTLPDQALHTNFKITIGEMVVVLAKVSTHD